MNKIIVTLSMLVVWVHAYIDIPLNITRESDSVAYKMPAQIDQLNYEITVSLENGNQRILSQFMKKQKKKKKSIMHDMKGFLSVSSLEGYSFQGWKRFFIQAFMYISQRYYHEIPIDLQGIKVSKSQQDKQKQIDGVIQFGPQIEENKFYNQIKKNTQYIRDDIVSIYRGLNDKNARMQLGGYEQTFARGHRNGILFYILNLISDRNKWKMPIKSISCIRERNGQDDQFRIINSEMNLSLSLESPYMVLPSQMKIDFQRSFQTPHITCNSSEQGLFLCQNMTSVDLSLNLIEFKIDDQAHINISLYDLRKSYNESKKQTVFFIKFSNDASEWQFGQSLFKSYYIAIDMSQKQMFFSPINRFPESSFGVYVLRVFVGFGLFTIVAAFGAMLWQTFNDPFRKNRFQYGNDGVRLVSYERPNQIQD